MEHGDTVKDFLASIRTYNPVMHFVSGENLTAEDFKDGKFVVDGTMLEFKGVGVGYPVMVVDGKPATGFYLILYSRNGAEDHEVIVYYPSDKQKQALAFYAAIERSASVRADELYDSDADAEHDDYWSFVKTFNADKCRNPFSLLNAVCECSRAIQDFSKCRSSVASELLERSIQDFAGCTGFMVGKALSIMQNYCRRQLQPEGFDIFSSPVVVGRCKMDFWKSYAFRDEADGSCHAAFQVTVRGGQRGWLIANSELELQRFADAYPSIAKLLKDGVRGTFCKEPFEPTPDYPLEEFYALRMRELLICLGEITAAPVVPADIKAASCFVAWGLRNAEYLGKESLSAFDRHLKSSTLIGE